MHAADVKTNEEVYYTVYGWNRNSVSYNCSI